MIMLICFRICVYTRCSHTVSQSVRQLLPYNLLHCVWESFHLNTTNGGRRRGGGGLGWATPTQDVDMGMEMYEPLYLVDRV